MCEAYDKSLIVVYYANIFCVLLQLQAKWIFWVVFVFSEFLTDLDAMNFKLDTTHAICCWSSFSLEHCVGVRTIFLT